jgi:chromosome segregation ATPase
MAARKKVEEKRGESNYDNLYVALYDPEDKRKNILLSIKQSLVIQEEHEKVLNFRKEKSRVLGEIKSEMEQLNSSYQKLRKYLPNVKSVISHTEKELNSLDDNIEMLKKEVKVTNDSIKLEEQIKSQLKMVSNKDEKKDSLTNISGELDLDLDESNKPKKEKKKSEKKLTRIDRIQNTLKVIESKLKSV